MSGARQGWEDSQFPILCETCLGDNPYVRMTRQGFGKECKICGRPFTVFKWCPGAGMRYKKTEICQTCSKIKNVCQTCVLDLEYGLPVQVRDAVLQIEETAPKSDVNREYFVAKQEALLGPTETLVNYGKSESVAKQALRKMARSEPYYKRNQAHICSFYVKGECKRGEECPYRHELPVDGELANQNIKDRFYGQNDPVAKKMLNNLLTKPADESIASLLVMGVEAGVKEEDLRAHFSVFGELKSIIVVAKTKCAFVNYINRSDAEDAAEKTTASFVINGVSLKLQWGKKHGGGSSQNAPPAQTAQLASIDPSAIPLIPPPPGEVAGSFYASTNPHLLGSSAKTYRA